MAPLWGVLAALLALGEGRGDPPEVTPRLEEGEGNPRNGSDPPGGGPWWFGGAPGGSLGGSLGVLAAAYLGLGGAVLLGLHLRHRALRNRKRRRRVRRGRGQRFFRAPPPNPYGNLPGPRPAPSAPLPPQQEEEGEGEEEEGYEEPESGSYENAPGGGAGSPYEVMAAGEGLREPPWRGRGGEEDSASYENMEGPLG